MVPRTPQLLRAAWYGLRQDPRERLSLGSMVERNAQRFGHHPSVRFKDEELSWAQLNVAMNRYASSLRALGVRRGDVVALMLGNRPELLALVGAMAKLGAVAALINTQQRADVLAHSVSVASPKLGIADAEHLPHLEGALPGSLALHQLPPPTSDANPASTRSIRMGDPVFYIYTSGTTGKPKASVMTHLRWFKAGAAFGEALTGLKRKDVVYVPLPFYHSLALTMVWSSCTLSGATIAMGDRFSAKGFWPECRAHGATVMAYIGETPRYLLARPPSRADRDHGVRRAMGVGFRPELQAEFLTRFGLERICESYGASEGNTAFFNVLNVPGTLGVCVSPHALVEYDEATGEPRFDARGRLRRVKRGETGLLLGKITRRYPFDGYTDSRSTQRKIIERPFGFPGRWFNTGDLMRKVGFGHAVFVDRVGDTFRWKSENVSTGEVERTIAGAEGISECAVYGVTVPHNEGRAGMAAVVGELDVEGLNAHLSGALPGYAIPVFLRVVEALETTGTFKHRKNGLREAGYASADLVRVGGQYVPLTATLLDAIDAGDLRL